ncbi:MAG: nicotinate-nucleotide adenylyltransferase [Legionella sp.]
MISIAIFGGTFDPVHNGHIQTSLAIQAHCDFDQYYFLPCKLPVHKAPSLASNPQRVDMLELALNELPQFAIDLREIERSSPSYMIETLTSIRQQYPDAALTLIMGYDTFCSLPLWFEWQQLIKLAHLLIINRGQAQHVELAQELQQLLKHHQTHDKVDLINKHSGFIYLFNAGDYAISSTEIRTGLKQQQQITQMLPAAVYDYIKKWNLYQ